MTISLSQTFKISLYALFLTVCSTASAQTVAPPEYIEQISPQVYIPNISIGATYQNKQIAGDNYFCVSGGGFFLLENMYQIATGTYEGYITGDLLNTPQGGTTNQYYVDIVSQYGAGDYGMFSNNSMGCPLAENPVVQGSAYTYVRLDSAGEPTYFANYTFVGGGTVTPTPTTQYINIISPEYGTTTGSVPVISIQYRTPFSFDARPTTTRKFVIRDAVSLIEEFVYEETVVAGASENITINEPVILNDGSKLIYAYYETENGVVYSEIADSFFNVNTNTYQIATGLSTPISTPTESQNDCGTFDVGCQFQKALMFLFYPSQAVLDRYSNLWQNISTKKPFGYVTVTIQQLTNLDTNSAHAFDIGEVPFQTEIFQPFKIAVGSILWALFAIYFYQRRLKHLDI